MHADSLAKPLHPEAFSSFAFARGGYLAEGLLGLDTILRNFSFGYVLLPCSFLRSTQQGGRRNLAMGFHVKTVPLILLEGFPSRFSFAGDFPRPRRRGDVFSVGRGHSRR